MEKHQLEHVFTPTSSAKVTFVERKKINNRLVRALATPGTQVVIYGYSGAGKTTLLENVLNRTYEKQINTNCMKGMTFEQVILDAFDQLEEFYVGEVTNNKKHQINTKAKTEYLAIQAQISTQVESSTGDKQVRVIPPQLSPQNLGRLLGESGYCWVLEDFHKIEGEDKEKLAQLMKVFVNLSSEHPDLKVIALGAVNTAHQVVKLDKEMRLRISEIHVSLMSEDEIKNIISIGCLALNIVIGNELQSEIVKYSNGLASICHKICQLMCFSAEIHETVDETYEFTQEDLDNAISDYLEDAEDSLRHSFDRAFRINKIFNVLQVLIKFDSNGAHIEDLFEKSKEYSINITKKKLEEDLNTLMGEEHGEIIKFEESSSKYSFIDPFYRCFAMVFLEEKDKNMKRAPLTQTELTEIFNRALVSVRTEFLEHMN
ncbi:Predicted ATPase (AAA+ superfamily) [Providencia rettgeri]|uniref:ATP-binding protein n=1 Tax=Providencia rettgeri TaxID=587 RepID=UPI001EF68733|nr:ATP-binding protein [Providencia rettgeri]CAB5538795.1 Predicted ATPase (AAA+ superfamily) [Providencia rettgeri]CAC9144844.1 Predicted ATPase (AAA+ superfamily) [Providencia rettgeri]